MRRKGKAAANQRAGGRTFQTKRKVKAQLSGFQASVARRKKS